MARSGAVNSMLAAALALPSGTIEQLDRRLGMAGLIPRKRGRYGPHYGADDLARLLIGVMVVTDGVERADGVVRAVQLVTRSALTQDLSVGSAQGGFQGDPFFKRAFVKVAADVLVRLAQSPDGDGRHYVALGLTFGAAKVCGWVEWRVPPGAPPQRDYYGAWGIVSGAPFKREARIEREALLQVASLLQAGAQ